MQEDKTFETAQNLMTDVMGYLPTLFAGLLVLVLGAVVAWIASKTIVRLLIFLRLDRVVTRLRWGRALEKGDVRHSLFGFVGTVVGVLIFLVFLDNAILIWKLTVLSNLLERFVALIPKLISAGVVLLIGWGMAAGVSHAVQRALFQEEFERARLVARIIHAAILVIAGAIALVELDIARGIVTGAFLITFGALALSFVLAFGLGSKRAVESFWEERLRPSHKPREGRAEAKSPDNY